MANDFIKALTDASMGASNWVADQTTKADMYSPEDVAMMLKISGEQKARSQSPLDMARYGASMSGKAAKDMDQKPSPSEGPLADERALAAEQPAAEFQIPEQKPVEQVYSQDMGAVQPAVAQEPVDMQTQPVEEMDFGSAAQQLSGMGKKELSKLQEGLDLQLGAAEKIGQIQYQKGQAQAAAQQGYIDEVEKIEQQRQIRRDNYELDREDQYMKISDLNSQIEKFELKDYWADKSTGQKVGLAIAMAMGAYASAITGGPNQAMAVIDNAIKRDMDLQKTKIGKLETVRNAAVRQYQQLRDNFVTMEAADDAAMSIAYNKAAMQVGQQAARFTGQEAIQKAQALKGQLIEKSEAYKMEAARKAADARFKMAGDLLNIQKTQKDIELQDERLESEKGKKYIPQLEAYGVDPERAKKASAALSDYEQADDLLSQIEKGAAAGIGGKLSPESRAEIKTAITLLTGKLRVAITGPGAFTQPEQEMIRDAIGDPTAFFQFDSSLNAKLKTMRNFMEKHSTAVVKEAAGKKGALLAQKFYKSMKKNKLDNLRQRKKLGLMKVSR